MRLVVFAIIFTVISTNERSWAESVLDWLLKECKEMDEAKQELSQLPEDTKVDLILKIQSNLKDETNLRRKLQCILDFAELIEGFVSECYPEWAPVRKMYSYYYNEDIWRYVLLNIEKRRVLLLKIELHKANVSEKTVIEIMESYLKLRKPDAHYLMYNKEREEAYTAFLKTRSDAEKVVMRTILSFMYRITDDDKVVFINWMKDNTSIIETTIANTDHTVINKIIQDTEEHRKSYRLLQLLQFCSYFHDEEFLENAFIDFAKKLNEKHGSSIQTCAFLANKKKGAIVLFDSFKSAYETLNHIKNDFPKEIALQPEELDDIILTTVSQNVLFKNRTVLKITSRTLLASDLKAWDYNKVISEVKNILNTEIESCLKTQEGDSVHLYYKKFESTLIAYQKMKEVLRSQKIAAELSIINATTVNPENLILVDIKG